MTLSVLYSFPNRLGVTGIGETAWQQVAGLTAKGVKVTLVCGTCEKSVPGLHRVVETMRIAGIKVPYRLLGQERVFHRHDHQTAKVLRREKSTIDVVHCWPGASQETLDAANALQIPSFLERPNTHTAYAFDAVAREHRSLGLPLPTDNTHARDERRLAVEEREFQTAGTLLCPSAFVAKTFSDRGFEAAKIALHQYGCDMERFYPSREKKRTSQLVAVFVGRCEPRKGLHYALKAWHASGAGASGAKLRICGSFMDGYEAYLKPLIDHPSIEIVGFTDDVPAVMREADLFILPAIEEGSALVTYEARASGNVLLVSDASGARVTHGVNGFVHTAGNTEELAGHLKQVIESPELLRYMRDASLRDRDELSWAAAATRLVDLYEERRLRAKRVGPS